MTSPFDPFEPVDRELSPDRGVPLDRGLPVDFETPLEPGLPQHSEMPADTETAVLGQGDSTPSHRGRRSKRTGRAIFIVMIVLGLLCVLGGGAALARELTRAATPAEAAAALQQEIATRWERLPAGKIFPATVSYTNSDGNSMAARLVGVAPAASCRDALDPAGYSLVRGLGCVTILRATYVDGSGALATTVGIAVLRSPSAAQNAAGLATSLGPSEGLHAVSFSGTSAAQFGDAARGSQGSAAAGPYLMLYTAGYTDGLPGSDAVAQATELTTFGTGVDSALQAVLTKHGKPCEMKDIKC